MIQQHKLCSSERLRLACAVRSDGHELVRQMEVRRQKYLARDGWGSLFWQKLGMTLISRLRTPPDRPSHIMPGDRLPLYFSSPSLQSKFKVNDFLLKDDFFGSGTDHCRQLYTP